MYAVSSSAQAVAVTYRPITTLEATNLYTERFVTVDQIFIAGSSYQIRVQLQVNVNRLSLGSGPSLRGPEPHHPPGTARRTALRRPRATREAQLSAVTRHISGRQATRHSHDRRGNGHEGVGTYIQFLFYLGMLQHPNSVLDQPQLWLENRPNARRNLNPLGFCGYSGVPSYGHSGHALYLWLWGAHSVCGARRHDRI